MTYLRSEDIKKRVTLIVIMWCPQNSCDLNIGLMHHVRETSQRSLLGNGQFQLWHSRTMMVVKMIKVDKFLCKQIWSKLNISLIGVSRKVRSVVIFNFSNNNFFNFPNKKCQRNSILPEEDSFSNSLFANFPFQIRFPISSWWENILDQASMYHCNWTRKRFCWTR